MVKALNQFLFGMKCNLDSAADAETGAVAPEAHNIKTTAEAKIVYARTSPAAYSSAVLAHHRERMTVLVCASCKFVHFYGADPSGLRSEFFCPQ